MYNCLRTWFKPPWYVSLNAPRRYSHLSLNNCLSLVSMSLLSLCYSLHLCCIYGFVLCYLGVCLLCMLCFLHIFSFLALRNKRIKRNLQYKHNTKHTKMFFLGAVKFFLHSLVLYLSCLIPKRTLFWHIHKPVNVFIFLHSRRRVNVFFCMLVVI